MKSNHLFLSQEDIANGTNKGLAKYQDLNFLERFAMFNGVSQLLELRLKNLLIDKFQYDLEKIEKWTLGKTCYELESKGLRADFIFLLKSVIEYRNYIAHELLANRVLIQDMLQSQFPSDHYDKDQRLLDKAIYELEQLVFLFIWTNSNNTWD